MKNYDYKLIKEIIKAFDDAGVLVEATCGMNEDWFWTASTIWENGSYYEEYNSMIEGGEPEIAGIKGSTWATPVISLELKDGSTRTFNCYTGQDTAGILDKIQKQMLWASGPLSSPVQEMRDGLIIEDFKPKN